MCSRNPEGGCNGCYRTKDELTNWNRKTEEEQRAIWRRLFTQTPYLLKKVWHLLMWIFVLPFALVFLLIVLIGLPVKSVWETIVLLPFQVFLGKIRR